jgi:hypothetical protein
MSPGAYIKPCARNWPPNRNWKQLYRDLELPVAEVLFRIERNGVLIDAYRAGPAKPRTWAARCRPRRPRRMQLAGQPFNLNSPKQLAEILFNQQGLPVVKKTPSGGLRRTKKCWKSWPKIIRCRKILDYRSLAKLKNTYTDKLPKMIERSTGRVHTSFGKPWRSPDGSLRPSPTCKTSLSAPPKADASVRPSSRSGNRPYRQRRLFADRAAHHGPFVDDARLLEAFAQAKTYTAPPPPRCSASRRSRSATNSAAPPRPSTSA